MISNVVVLGASDKPERYSYQAVKLLQQKGLTPYPVHPQLQTIDGIQVYNSIDAVQSEIDTVSLYLNPNLSLPLVDLIIKLNPRRVICNPGTESAELKSKLELAGIQVIEACTLVMLKTGQW